MTKLAIYDPISVESAMTAWLLATYDGYVCMSNELRGIGVDPVDELLIIGLTDDFIKIARPEAKSTQYLLRMSGSTSPVNGDHVTYSEEPLHLFMWKHLKRRGAANRQRSRFLTEIQKIAENPRDERNRSILVVFQTYANCLDILDEFVEAGIKGVEMLYREGRGFGNFLIARKHLLSEEGVLRMDISENVRNVRTTPLDTSVIFSQIQEPDEPASAFLDIPEAGRLVFLTGPDTDTAVEVHPRVQTEDGVIIFIKGSVKDEL